MTNTKNLGQSDGKEIAKTYKSYAFLDDMCDFNCSSLFFLGKTRFYFAIIANSLTR